MNIVITAFCRKPEFSYGTLLTLDTVRIGFPKANVTVIDNFVVPEVQSDLKEACDKIGATLVQTKPNVPHHQIISGVLGLATGPIIFLDGDLIFWQKVEHWKFDALMSGRLIPDFHDPYTGCITKIRLHTSFLWIPDAAQLRNALKLITDLKFDFDPYRPVMMPDNDKWVRWDCMSAATMVLKDRVHAFTEHELDAYDHLFCGSHIDLVAPALPTKIRQRWETVHGLARDRKISSLRGIWREQEQFFNA